MREFHHNHMDDVTTTIDPALEYYGQGHMIFDKISQTPHHSLNSAHEIIGSSKAKTKHH